MFIFIRPLDIVVGGRFYSAFYVIFFLSLRFYRVRSCNSVRLPVRPSVCLSHACFVTKPNNALLIFDTRRKGNHSDFLTPTVVGGLRPCRLKFALKVTHADFDTFPLITS